MHESRRTEQIAVHRHASQYTRVGPPLIVLPIDDAVDKLALSGFMQPWIKDQILQWLLDGKSFEHRGDPFDEGWKGRADGLVSQYALATAAEIELHASTGGYTAALGKSLTKRVLETAYVFDFKKDRSGLPRQARILLEHLEKAAAGGTELTAAAVELCCAGIADLNPPNTKQPATRIWGFYRSSRFKEEGFVSEKA